MDEHRMRNFLLTVAGLGLLVVVLYFVDQGASTKLRQVAALFAIWGIAAVSLNLINGVTGILSLGHHGFMLLGGYTTALLILPDAGRARISESARSMMNDFTLGLSVENWARGLGLEALAGPDTLWVRFIVALVIGGVVAALFGLLVGTPSLRLRGDYLAIVTFGFGEIIRLLASTDLMAPFTNGALGYSGVPSLMGKSVWWTFAILVLTVFIMARLKFSSYGRALQAIREDEIAAQAMGVNLAYHKALSFALSAFFAGIAGGLYVSWLASARLDSFLFFLTFFFLVAVSVGGTGSVTGTLFGTALVVWVLQYGDPLEQSYPLGTWVAAAGVAVALGGIGAYLYRRARHLRPTGALVAGGLLIVGLAIVLFGWIAPNYGVLEAEFRAFGLRRIGLAVLLVLIMVARPEGMFGRAEFSWAWLLRERRDQPTDAERAQDAWLSNPELRERLDDPEPAAHPLQERGERPEGTRATAPEGAPLDPDTPHPEDEGGR